MTVIGVFVCRPIDMLAPCHTVCGLLCVCDDLRRYDISRVLHSRHDERCSMTIPLQTLWYKWHNTVLESEFCPLMYPTSCILTQAAFPSSFPCPWVLSTTLSQCILSTCCHTWSCRGSAWLTAPKLFQTEAGGIDFSCVRLGPKIVNRCPDLLTTHPSCLAE